MKPRPSNILNDLLDAHTSAAAALLALPSDTPKCVRDALVLVRDQPGEMRKDFYRGIRKEPQVSGKVVKALRATERARGIGDRVQIGQIVDHDPEMFRRLLWRMAERWALPPSLQQVDKAGRGVITILGVHYPWMGNPAYLSLTGDGCGMLKFRVVEATAEGPVKFRLLTHGDEDLWAFLREQADGSSCVIHSGIHFHLKEMAARGFAPGGEHAGHYYQTYTAFDQMVKQRGLDGDIGLDELYLLAREGLRPPSYWYAAA